MFAYNSAIGKLAKRHFVQMAWFVLLLFSAVLHAQTPKPVVTLNVDQIISRASDEKRKYLEEFRNLLAKETKTFRLFDHDKVKKERKIVSNFLVYDLSKNKNEVTEFRNVLSVDGRPVAEVEKRAVDLFERIAKAETTQKELERIQKESLRYDEEIQIVGLTLFQGISMDERVRNSFLFELAGKDRIGDSEVYVINYRQTWPSPLIRITDKAAAAPAVLDYDFDLDGLTNVNERLSGTFWIDANTFQLVREKRELSIKPDDFDAPLTVTANEFEYASSSFGIRTPKRLTHTQFRIDKRNRRSIREIEFVFEYSEFTRPDVEVKSDKAAG